MRKVSKRADPAPREHTGTGPAPVSAGRLKGGLTWKDVLGQSLIPRNAYKRFFNFSNSKPWHRPRGRLLAGKKWYQFLGSLAAHLTLLCKCSVRPETFTREKNGLVLGEHTTARESGAVARL